GAKTFLCQDTDRIAAEPEISGMAEAHHAAIAHDQVEAHRGEREDQHAGEQRHHERIAGQRRVKRDQRERDQQAGDDDAARREREFIAHLLAAGKSPSGRNTRMPAISIYISIDDSAGAKVSAALLVSRSRKMSGRKARPTVSIKPTM